MRQGTVIEPSNEQPVRLWRLELVFLWCKKKLRPLPVETRPAKRVNEALGDLNAGKVLGRIVLDFESTGVL